jgi:hypothetical protein
MSPAARALRAFGTLIFPRPYGRGHTLPPAARAKICPKLLFSTKHPFQFSKDQERRGGVRKRPVFAAAKADLASLPEYKNLLLAAQKQFSEPLLRLWAVLAYGLISPGFLHRTHEKMFDVQLIFLRGQFQLYRRPADTPVPAIRTGAGHRLSSSASMW